MVPARADKPTTSQGGQRQNISSPYAARTTMQSQGPCTALTHTGWYNAASSRPTTAAFAPEQRRLRACLADATRPRKATYPTTSNAEGR